MYASDNGFYVTPNSPVRWYNLLRSYVGNDTKVYACPSCSYTGRGYAVNLNFSNWTSSTTVTSIVGPSTTAMFVDAAQCNSSVASNGNPESWCDFATGESDWQWTPPTSLTATTAYYAATGGNETRRPQPRHNRGLNVGYCDGHATWMGITNFLGPMLGGWPYGDVKNSWDNK